MKKFKEWKESLNEDMSAAAFRNTIGGSTVNVDPVLRSKLRTKILQIVQEFPEKNSIDLFQEIMAVVGSLITKGSGTNISSGKVYNQLNQMPAGGQQAQNK